MLEVSLVRQTSVSTSYYSTSSVSSTSSVFYVTYFSVLLYFDVLYIFLDFPQNKPISFPGVWVYGWSDPFSTFTIHRRTSKTTGHLVQKRCLPSPTMSKDDLTTGYPDLRVTTVYKTKTFYLVCSLKTLGGSHSSYHTREVKVSLSTIPERRVALSALLLPTSHDPPSFTFKKWVAYNSTTISVMRVEPNLSNEEHTNFLSVNWRDQNQRYRYFDFPNPVSSRLSGDFERLH